MKLIIVLLVVTYFAAISSGRNIKPKGPPFVRRARDLGNSFDESINPYQMPNYEWQKSEFEDDSLNRHSRDVSFDEAPNDEAGYGWEASASYGDLVNGISNDDVVPEWENAGHDDDSSLRYVRDVSNSDFDEAISPYQLSNDDVVFEWQNSGYDDDSAFRHTRDVSSNFDVDAISSFDDAVFDWQNSEDDDEALIRHVRDVGSNFDESISLNDDQDFDWVNQNDADVYAINHIRERRQLIGNVEAGRESGVKAMIGAEGKLLDNNGHTLTGRGTVTKEFNPNQPPVMSGVLDYVGPRAGASVGVDHARNMGTSLNTQGNYNFYTSPNRRTTLDGNAYYQQQFQPRSRPDFGGGITLRHRF